MPDYTHDEKALIQLLAQDSEYAFALVFDKYRKRVYGSALLFLKTPQAAEEIVQEVFLRLWQKRRELPQINFLNSYINTIARNLVIDQLRKLSFETAYHATHREPVAEDNVDFRVRNSESAQLLAKAIEALPGRQRAVYELARMKGLSQEEIAASLGISKNTVKTHMNAALASIRTYLLTYYPDTLAAIPVVPLLLHVLEK